METAAGGEEKQVSVRFYFIGIILMRGRGRRERKGEMGIKVGEDD